MQSSSAPSSSSSPSPIVPAFFGHIATTYDALVVFEACLSGRRSHVARRPFDRERPDLIRSGNVFVFEQHSSGMKRWTDGLPWSPSRVLDDFLVYRELERPLPPGRRRAPKKTKIGRPDDPRDSNYQKRSSYETACSAATSPGVVSNPDLYGKEDLRLVVGSLVDSYDFKKEGLVKKTISVTVGDISHHLVAYISIADVLNNRMNTPSRDPELQYLIPRPSLITGQNFRVQIDKDEPLPHDQFQDLHYTTTAPHPEIHSHEGMSISTHILSPTYPISPSHDFPPPENNIFHPPSHSYPRIDHLLEHPSEFSHTPNVTYYSVPEQIVFFTPAVSSAYVPTGFWESPQLHTSLDAKQNQTGLPAWY